MRLARIAHPDGVAFVVIEGVVDAGLDGEDLSGAVAKEILDHPFGTPEFTGREWPLGQTRLLAPILPSKVIAVGRNYADHAAELGNAVPDEPPAPDPVGRSVCPIATAMRSAGTPSASAAIWVRTVRAPCPMSAAPISTS